MNNYLPLSGGQMTGSLTAPSFIANNIDCTVDSQGGGWIRYSSGLQICWGEYSRTTEENSTINFPKAFSLSYAIGVTVSGQSSTVFAGGWSAGYVYIGNTNSGSFTYTAVGWWK